MKIDFSPSSMKPKPFSSSTPKRVITDVEEGSNRAVCNTAKPPFLKDVSVNTTVELDREFQLHAMAERCISLKKLFWSWKTLTWKDSTFKITTT